MDNATRATMQAAAQRAARALQQINAALIELRATTDILKPLTATVNAFTPEGDVLLAFSLGATRARTNLCQAIEEIPGEAWDLMLEGKFVGTEEVRALLHNSAIPGFLYFEHGTAAVAPSSIPQSSSPVPS